MTDSNPDQDLRDAFRRCRAEDKVSAPAFRGLATPRPPRRAHTYRLAAALAVAVAAALFAFIRPANPPATVMTLAAAMPRPLLPAAPSDPLFRITSPVGTDAAASDFLLPANPHTLTLPFP